MLTEHAMCEALHRKLDLQTKAALGFFGNMIGAEILILGALTMLAGLMGNGLLSGRAMIAFIVAGALTMAVGWTVIALARRAPPLPPQPPFGSRP
jgi:amino acid transporter